MAELIHFFGDAMKIMDIQEQTLVAAFDKPFPHPQAVLNLLGGSIKLVEIFDELEPSDESLATAAADHLIQKFPDYKGKLRFGVSVYNFAQKHEIVLKRALKNIKKSLTEEGVSSRFVNHGFKNVENAAIQGEKLLQKGAEIIIIKGSESVYIGETKALQDFESYSDRDYGKPARDPRLGMLPPKLAQIMINLAGKNTNKGQILYDPFCGVGTVLMEGVLMGYQTVGSDINEQVLQKAQTNLEWLCRKNRQQFNFRLFPKDARQLTAADFQEKIDLVVTESYLGPPVSRLPLPVVRDKNFYEIKALARGFFRSLAIFVSKGTPVVISFPFYREQHRFYFIPEIREEIEQQGYKIEPLFPEDLVKNFRVRALERGSLLYDRPDQVVGREIFKFIKT